MLVHHSHFSRNNQEETSLCQLAVELDLQFYPLHRLDKRTSGIVLGVKRKDEYNLFSNLFTEHQIEKKYLAIVRGFTPESLLIDSPVKGRDANVYKSASSVLNTLEQFEIDTPTPPYPTSRYSFIEYTPKTGRLHQLRIHSNKIAHPIIGDKKYGNREHNQTIQSLTSQSIMLLHAKYLRFINPITKKGIEINSPPPNSFRIVLDYLRSNSL